MQAYNLNQYVVSSTEVLEKFMEGLLWGREITAHVQQCACAEYLGSVLPVY